MPTNHLHLPALKSLLLRAWVLLRSASVPSQVLAAVVGVLVTLKAGVVDVGSLLPHVARRVRVITSNSWVAPIVATVDRLLGGTIWILNPFEKAGDALRLPPVKVRPLSLHRESVGPDD